MSLSLQHHLLSQPQLLLSLFHLDMLEFPLLVILRSEGHSIYLTLEDLSKVKTHWYIHQNYLEIQNAKLLCQLLSTKLLLLLEFQLFQLNPHDLTLLSQYMIMFQTLYEDGLEIQLEASYHNEQNIKMDPLIED